MFDFCIEKFRGTSWEDFMVKEMKQPYFAELTKFVEKEYSMHTVYPPQNDIFNAFMSTGIDDIKVVILGQDPYHGKNQAHGLSFSVPSTQCKIPPSLKNIYREIHRDLGIDVPIHGCLLGWARQGVFLLNTVLTVRGGEAGSHAGHGWEEFTDHTIQTISELNRPVVFMLWGNYARAKKKLITNPIHLILETSHPSPMSVRHGFDGCGHFGLANKFLEANGIDSIRWQL